jgi:uncharacterized SAM-binding protein YcdF (DUF218 family)
VRKFAQEWKTWLPIVGGLCVAGLLVPSVWLPAFGYALDVSPDPRPSDVIIVLGGGEGDRQRYAGELFERGLAPRVIATGAPTGSDANARELIGWGVPPGSIILANGTQNTHDDALRSRQLMEQHGWKTALLVTDPYHARRSLWTFRTAFAGSSLQVAPVPVADGWFDANHWWESKSGFVAVNEEYGKLVYYVVRGFVAPSAIVGP